MKQVSLPSCDVKRQKALLRQQALGKSKLFTPDLKRRPAKGKC
jgi:hypothetical protein